MEEKIVFKKGTYQLNRDPNYNFQLNRVINWNNGELSDIESIAEKITDSASWKISNPAWRQGNGRRAHEKRHCLLPHV